MRFYRSRNRSLPSALNTLKTAIPALLLAAALSADAQAPPVQPPSSSAPPDSRHKSHAGHQNMPEAKPISDEDLRQRLQGKTFYLRGGYIGNDLSFDMHGGLVGSSSKGAFTLGVVEIQKVHRGKHQLRLEGIRYGIHFLDSDSAGDAAGTFEKLRITPKKKLLRITVQMAEPAKKKRSRDEPEQPPAEIINQAAANRILQEALDRIFSADLDQRMIASLPDYWQSYYHSLGAKSTFKPSDSSVLRQSMVDQKARLLTNFEPPSNDFAQTAGIVGVAQYHVVVGRDGKVDEIAVGRPIGFGLDENAVASIRKASFQPAIKDGKPVPVLLDLLVEFHIYSNRTGSSSGSEAASATLSEPQAPSLPGPYSANQPAPKQP
jgi:TonB family protein